MLIDMFCSAIAFGSRRDGTNCDHPGLASRTHQRERRTHQDHRSEQHRDRDPLNDDQDAGDDDDRTGDDLAAEHRRVLRVAFGDHTAERPEQQLRDHPGLGDAGGGVRTGQLVGDDRHQDEGGHERRRGQQGSRPEQPELAHAERGERRGELVHWRSLVTALRLAARRSTLRLHQRDRRQSGGEGRLRLDAVRGSDAGRRALHNRPRSATQAGGGSRLER